MASSVQPLVIDYSFAANRRQATDMVDLDQLDGVIVTLTDKINEIIAALDVTTRDDNTLHDGIIEPRNLHPETESEFTALVQQAVDQSLGLESLTP
jgi:hypothetical protein